MSKPPAALGNDHVIEYAIIDDEVTFEQRHVLNVGGEWLGAVLNLAICQSLDKSEFMVFHCNHKWEILGVAAGFKSIQAAKKKQSGHIMGFLRNGIQVATLAMKHLLI
jgi:hypothetical protein